jgi:hypothetical protein
VVCPPGGSPTLITLCKASCTCVVSAATCTQ